MKPQLVLVVQLRRDTLPQNGIAETELLAEELMHLGVEDVPLSEDIAPWVLAAVRVDITETLQQTLARVASHTLKREPHPWGFTRPATSERIQHQLDIFGEAYVYTLPNSEKVLLDTQWVTRHFRGDPAHDFDKGYVRHHPSQAIEIDDYTFNHLWGPETCSHPICKLLKEFQRRWAEVVTTEDEEVVKVVSGRPEPIISGRFLAIGLMTQQHRELLGWPDQNQAVGTFDTYEEAQDAGEAKLRDGSWLSFTIEKRFYR